VLDTVDARASFLGIVHRLHENPTIPEYSGRSIVGWAGTGMLFMSLTGLWLRWPRGRPLSGLRWRRSTATSANLHHLLGFWISLPLAIVSASGIYLSFPQTARGVMSSVMPMSPQGPRRGAGEMARDLALTPDRALAIARAAAQDLVPAAIALPTAARAPSWRVDFHSAQGTQMVTVAVDDRVGVARRQRPRSAMDPLDPRAQPHRPGMAARRISVRHLSERAGNHRARHLAARPRAARRRRTRTADAPGARRRVAACPIEC
jgi:uncharacterized iron-regulated membrane protein